MLVLIVDDDAPARDALRFSLEAGGIEVQLAGGVDEAARLIAERNIDAVVTDLHMPLDGEQVLEHVFEARPGVPVIVVTGRDPQAAKRSSVGARAYAVLGKPFAPEKLVRLLREATKRPRAKRRPAKKPRR
jgi:two-component system C4-dicarboxylate transport response regulator DctD